MRTTNPSRRHALAGLLTVAPAVAVAKSLGGTPDGDDTELLALKPRFDELFERWAKMRIRARVEHRERRAALLRETGLDGPPGIDWDDPDWVRWHDAGRRYDDQQEKLTAAEVETDTWKIVDALDETADEILSYFPTALDGLRLQVRAIMVIEDDMVWGNESLAVAGFFEGLCAFLELPFPPYVVPPAG
jgi:hypothetical protein